MCLSVGTLGWGRRTPFFNLAPNYWPLKQLDDVNPNHIVVEVGIASSDHDRACETFYQLIGGRVDYGEAHAAEKALELYQLLCVDFFGIGSNYKWVKSIVSISGTLSGTTMGMYHHAIRDDDGCISYTRRHVVRWLGSMFGSTLGNPSPYGSISYLIACGFATLHKLQQHVPWLSNLYDLRMPQWAHASSSSWRTLYDPAHKPLNTDDNVFTCLLPQHRLAKNERLVHMDKIHLFSIVSQTTNVLTYPPVVEFATIAAICTMWKLQKVHESLNFINHLCGTRGDGDARELYTRLFRLLNQISGTSPCDTILPLPPTQLELGFLTT
ncbi:hypothetical protein DYB38_009395 [Aphanomyces astaci]|uniref:Lipase-like C-terminal domain-containing protein n=1 Tax=Aphanomyces astaci TaxID=112090 RepID=A0A397CW17_APHAT|nr:hypothetical protein DYB38_009395 [Aphanomyces astaci]